MAILEIEKEIIDRLKSLVNGLQIEAYPENPSEYRLLHPKGAVLVRFQAATYNPPSENMFVQQAAVLEFTLTLMVKGLRDKNGAYSYIDSLISALSGYSPTGCGQIYPSRVAFLTEEAGVWRYSLAFNVKSENYS